MNILNTLIESTLIEKLGWTLLHSCWQIGLITLVYVGVTAFARRSARIRYWAGCVALPLMLAAPMLSFFQATAAAPGGGESIGASAAVNGSVPAQLNNTTAIGHATSAASEAGAVRSWLNIMQPQVHAVLP